MTPGRSAFCWGVLFAVSLIFLFDTMSVLVLIPAFVFGAFFGVLLSIASPPKPESPKKESTIPLSEYVADPLPPLLPRAEVKLDDGFDQIVGDLTR